jgi:hypothetical protein
VLFKKVLLGGRAVATQSVFCSIKTFIYLRENTIAKSQKPPQQRQVFEARQNPAGFCVQKMQSIFFV